MFSERLNLTSGTNRLAQTLEQMKAMGRRVLDLTVSNPTLLEFAYDHRRIIQALSNPAGLIYTPDPCGITSARDAICSYYRASGVWVDAESIYLTASTSEAYGFLFKLLGNPGDQILIPSPGYPLLSYLAQFEFLEANTYPQRYAPENGWYVDPDAIEARITPKTRALVVVSPNNPTGTYLKEREMAALDEICCRNDLALIVDEVFFDYFADDADQRAVSALGHCRALTFVLNGLSKLVALPQVKLGWIVVSGRNGLAEAAKARLEMLLDFYLSVSTQVQLAVGELLNLRKNIQPQIKARVALNEKTLCACLAATSNCRMLEREGGWYAVIEVNDHWEDEARVLKLLELDHTLVHPGYFYDFHRAGFVVVSLLTPPAIFQSGIENLVQRFGQPSVGNVP